MMHTPSKCTTLHMALVAMVASSEISPSSSAFSFERSLIELTPNVIEYGRGPCELST